MPVRQIVPMLRNNPIRTLNKSLWEKKSKPGEMPIEETQKTAKN